MVLKNVNILMPEPFKRMHSSYMTQYIHVRFRARPRPWSRPVAAHRP